MCVYEILHKISIKYRSSDIYTIKIRIQSCYNQILVMTYVQAASSSTMSHFGIVHHYAT